MNADAGRYLGPCAQAAARVWAAPGRDAPCWRATRVSAAGRRRRSAPRGAPVEVSVHDLHDSSNHEALAATDPDVGAAGHGIQRSEERRLNQPEAAGWCCHQLRPRPVSTRLCSRRGGCGRAPPSRSSRRWPATAGEQARRRLVCLELAPRGLSFCAAAADGTAGCCAYHRQPGFVDTPITANPLPRRALRLADVVGRGIVAPSTARAWSYLPWFLAIYSCDRSRIPESLFKRVSF